MRKLDKKNIEDILALTPMQEGMLSHYLIDPGNRDYFEQLSLDISGEIEKALFEKAWDFVIRSNEMLRAVFWWEKVDKPIQIILKEHRFQATYYDFSGKNTKDPQKHLEALKAKNSKEPFDLRDVCFRVTLCKLQKNRYVMMISNHHILYDGWSNAIILNEFLAAYHTLANGEELVKPVKTKFREFIKWNRNRDLEREPQFWRDNLSGFDAAVKVPFKNTKIMLREGDGGNGNFKVRLSKELTEGLEVFSKRYRVTLASLFYSAWGLLLQKYNNCEDVILGTTVSGRSTKMKGVEHIVGLFINTLPLRVKTHAGETLSSLVSRVNNLVQRREEFESTPLGKIKEYSQWDNKENLFDFIVSVENYPLDAGLKNHRNNHHNKLSIASYSMFETTNYDLTVGITLSDDIELLFTFRKQSLEPVDIEIIFQHFRCILENIIKHPDHKSDDLALLAEEEKYRLLYDFNKPEMQFSRDKTIHRLFEEQVERSPGCTAVVFEDRYLSYSELNEKGNQLAGVLQAKGAKPGDIVCIMVERSIEMIVGLLAILKAGGAYLPIDPGCPAERIGYMIEDSGSQILVTTSALFAEGMTKAAVIFADGSYLYNESASLVPRFPASHPSDLAYVIYTSGTTGKPKGVLVEHGNLLTYLNAFDQEFELGADDVVLQQASYAFDVFVEEMYPALLHGGRVAVATRDQVPDINLLVPFIIKHHVTMISCSPLMLNQLNQREEIKASGIKIFISGGDVLKGEYIDNLLAVGAVYNTYGPTETTVCATYYRCPDRVRSDIPVGKPITNYNVYVLDEESQLLPVGVPGELCIAGDGVARGYLNRPELTAETFSTTPLYRTGDRVRWLPDGNIEFLGRIDNQVKIRGFRIEPGEIENQLLKTGEIKEAVVLVKEVNKEKELCAYFVSLSGEKTDISELKERLAVKLPQYMIPAYFKQLDKFPLIANWKIDRKALPMPGIITNEVHVAPRDEVEKKLVDIWAGVLNIEKEKISTDVNFFEIGGHSLNAGVRKRGQAKNINVLTEPYKMRNENDLTIASIGGSLSGVK